MAYDRFDPRYDREGGRFGRESSQSRGRWPDDDSRRWRGEGGRDDDRGWFERAGEQIASWFGDDDDDDRERRSGGRGWSDDQGSRPRGQWSSGGMTSRSDRMGDRGREPWSNHDEHMSRHQPWGGGQFERGRDRDRHDRSRDYRPMTGDYGRSEGMMGRGTQSGGFEDSSRQQSWGRGSSQPRSMHDPHYHNWRQRQMEELDRDYDDYCRENQSRFESEFGSWRERRQQKRSMLSGIREHMEVVGNDDQPVGTVDRVAGDRIILTKSDPEAGGTHHSISCTNIDRIEDNRVILDCSADQAKQSWRDDDRSRGLNEREDQGEAGPHILNRSFEGTYR